MIGIIIASFYEFSPEGWKAVGFSAKQKSFDSVSDTTFLRGTWWPHLDGSERWGILPSAFVKLTKVQTPLDTRDKFNQIALGMVKGMGHVPPKFPILGKYILKVHEVCSLRLADPVLELRNKYKPKSDVTDEVDRDFVLTWMCERYDTSYGEIEELEDILQSLGSLPSYVGHPLLSKLMEDY
jgi:hypothetical protein